eukprot:CAMPEP_0171808410 /NCGR_PEP_ID=MMETSP0991-20121206/76382_1 /TAXON_ID=483369 /ORGANISM="non described non described, Strain CCMP2098" /LENGTH=68 /DNA_ID=CAMNT_0012421353 /DNA_START=64 /DNA_END=266 /DNA_ORIENTATION=-
MWKGWLLVPVKDIEPKFPVSKVPLRAVHAVHNVVPVPHLKPGGVGGSRKSGDLIMVDMHVEGVVVGAR